jgi:hypothetical protein
MATIDDDLTQIERDIRTLKIEYEQFFGGGRPRPPQDTQWRVDTAVRRWNERSAELSFAQRYRFNNLAQTYAKYQDMWRKKTLQKEGGVATRHFGSAAKAIEAARMRGVVVPQPPDEAAVADPAADSVVRAAEARQAAVAFALSLSDPDREPTKIVTLYQKVMEAHSEAGEKNAAPTLQAFERFVRKKTKELRDQGGDEVEYSVSIEQGRVKLTARIST